MPVDPWGGYVADSGYYSPDQGIWYGDDSGPSWQDLIQQGINAAQQAYIYGELGYPPQPPGSTNIYAPQYPQTQQPMPVPLPSPGLPVPGVAPQPGTGIQLSTTTLMLLVGGVLLFMLGSKKGR